MHAKVPLILRVNKNEHSKQEENIFMIDDHPEKKTQVQLKKIIVYILIETPVFILATLLSLPTMFNLEPTSQENYC